MSEKTKDIGNVDEIDEAEEEALLKSDGDEEDEADELVASVQDDDGDDSDLDEDEKYLGEYLATLSEISENRFAYDSYVKLTEVAHKLSDLDKIRQSYQLFSSAFPLAPELWSKYISIEMSIAASPEEYENIRGFFQKAFEDYYSTDIAYEYALFCKTAKLKQEEVWPEILATYALHCMKGRQFFELFRKHNEERTDLSKEEKRDVYVQSYLKELKIPLYDMEESYIEFKIFGEKNKDVAIDWDKIDKDYNRAKTHLQRILPFEKQIIDLDPKFHQERALSYRNYIKEADKFLDENILQTLYERMTTECCLNAECWLDYISFIEYRDKYERPEELADYRTFQQTALDVSLRSIRNCTWNEKMYVKRIHLLEKSDKSRSDVQEVLENGLSVGLPTPEGAVTLWLEYLAYLRRNTSYENEEECEILRKNFGLCWNTLGKQWGVLADCNCEILQFWGRLEYGPLQDQMKGRDLWNTVMESSDNSTKSGLWIEFIQLEMRRDLECTRKLFKKALSSPGLDNSNVIASAWIRFERCNGNLKQLILCEEQCQTILSQLEFQNRRNVERTEQKPKSKGTKRKAGEAYESTIEKEFKKNPITDNHDSPKKQKIDNSSKTKNNHEYREHENEEIDLSKDHLRIFLSNLDYNITEEEIRENLSELQITNIDLIKASNGRGRGFGYAELVSEEEVEKALQLDRKLIKERPIFISSVLRDKEKREKFKYSDGLEPKKLFVKGLPYDVTKDELEILFGAHGKLKDIRLVCHKSGKPKGIAYVEYVNETSASIAVLKLDQLEMRGHFMNVSISAPPPKAQQKAPINANKLLGVGKKAVIKSEQKPRMSLIPSSVRKQFASSTVPIAAQTTNSTSAQPPKSNADFRKLLNK